MSPSLVTVKSAKSLALTLMPKPLAFLLALHVKSIALV